MAEPELNVYYIDQYRPQGNVDKIDSLDSDMLHLYWDQLEERIAGTIHDTLELRTLQARCMARIVLLSLEGPGGDAS